MYFFEVTVLIGLCISNSQIKRKKVSPLKITLLFLWHFFKQDKRITIMNIHEYQGKEILASYGVRVQRGIVANNPVEAVAAAKQLTLETGTSWYVVKAQIHAGGRGKGGGVKLAKNLDQVTEISEQIIGMQLITPQTPPEGKTVHKVLS